MGDRRTVKMRGTVSSQRLTGSSNSCGQNTPRTRESFIMNVLHEERQRLGTAAGVRNRISESAVAAAERVCGCGEPDLKGSSTGTIAPVGSRGVHTLRLKVLGTPIHTATGR